ncbi:type II toxin-antitoxin system prevent-host-death family antitoxin [Streptomyces avicenniae]|uniref:type II toxin-antitoxin system prevent-host-death family antitoxin n=1 Tax=Streptomyces avicenniae TaxID=500153 RepID=UPI00069AEA4F|nr:type II toxin-antitoxin system prevent-host-death family antitoxin [Streptomyces avicenniae]
MVEESELLRLLDLLVDRAADGGATVVTRKGERIAAVVSMKDYEAAEDAIEQAIGARTYDDDGKRYTWAEVFGDASSPHDRR